jgi:Zn finger protein HypA/HybF involved in hydrogenase expression
MILAQMKARALREIEAENFHYFASCPQCKSSKLSLMPKRALSEPARVYCEVCHQSMSLEQVLYVER